ncbi:twin-arginine translocation signal domain-containing protein [Thiomicrorhabdus sp. ZW0627]|uniref:twin-arginine translocation signal domain-containing protein n=1 Tax=Thiomicrorhabdus sp. ZW0627 TaxID=3039774 RepID=UPI0024364A8C|nr:twin-arginine translocation signal domain-containing protein [Thiomicrorhabdus sp. ZW0627]MDG6773732.1 twin-arginine translocation signal domain-containing protein [Thiomicrorhabdus sp. ZW0627]
MNKQTRRDFLKLAGASLVSASGMASAAENPFGFTEMKNGYSQVAEASPEGTCGNKPAPKPKPTEGTCGSKPAPEPDPIE